MHVRSRTNAVVIGTLAVVALLRADGALALDPPHVHEITMAAPDTISIELREGPISRGRLVKFANNARAKSGTWTEVEGEPALIIGARSDHARTADRAQILPLDRSAFSNASAYGPIGQRKVSAVYRKSLPWDSGTLKAGEEVVSFAHFIFLRLDGPLSPGRYVINWPSNAISPTDFTFDDKSTRSSSIHATQLGHRADDVSKYAYLALWLPGAPDNGAIDFRAYGLSQFHIIDEIGRILFSGSIEMRVGPSTKEPGSGVKGDSLTYTGTNGIPYQANRAGTFVFGLDYSAWRNARPGMYRILVAGLGTSYPFRIDPNIWYDAGRVAMAGLYHQRSGMPLDGRFGYERPESLTEASGTTVYQSKLPMAFSKEGGGFVDLEKGAKPPWITSEPVEDAWGGYNDAGDWDRHIIHVKVSYLLLDLFEQLSPAARQMRFGTPPSSEVLKDPLYQGKALPDLVHEAIWNLDFFRRLQRSDGAVRGGIESGGYPKKFEPSWLESHTVFAYAPDPEASFNYSAAATKLAIVLGDLGEKELATLFRESALRSWAWAEKAMDSPNHAFYEARALLGISQTDYETRLEAVLQRARAARFWAAATLFRLSGGEEYYRYVSDGLKERRGNLIDDGCWEYANTNQANADSDLKERIRRSIVEFARVKVVNPQRMPVAYRSLKHFDAPIGWGTGLAPTREVVSSLMRAHRITHSDEFVSAMLDGSGHILGANQIGMSFTTGLGKRWPNAPLHKDSIAAGVPAPAGITIYGWAIPANVISTYWYVWRESWSPMSDTIGQKRIDPPKTSFPLFEFFIDYPNIVMSSEYTVHQTIATTAIMWIYLQGTLGP